MAEISQIRLPSGSLFDIADAQARTDISAAQADIESINAILGTTTGAKALVFKGISTTILKDGEAQKPTINGQTVNNLTIGDIYFYQDAEFIWGANPEYETDNSKPQYVWHELGRLSGLGGLAYVSTATGSYTPAGTITQPTATFTGTLATITVSTTGVPGTITVTNTTSAYEVTSATGDSTYKPAGSVSASFSGTEAQISVGAVYTPAASVSLTTTSVSVNVDATATNTGNYQPAGSVSAPAINLATGGSTTSIAVASSKEVVNNIGSSAPNSTSAAGEIGYCYVSDGVLSLYKLAQTKTDSITTTDVTVKTGDATYTASAPTFTGTKVQLRTADITIPNNVTYTPTSTVISMSTSYTPSGNITNASFNGTPVRLVTANITTPSSIGFTGSALSMSTTYTPAGNVTVQAPTFEGTTATISVSPMS